MVAAAASILIVSSVKVPTQTIELIKSEMHHQLPDQRINALLRFQVHDLLPSTSYLLLLSNQISFQALWRNRFQVWQRLEENGQIAMKVVPSQIEFTLPSPKLGIESLPIIDPPWIPKTRTKISTIHESGQVSYFQSVNRELDFSTAFFRCSCQLPKVARSSRQKLSKVSSMQRPKRGGKSEKTFTSPPCLSLSGLRTSLAFTTDLLKTTKKVGKRLLLSIFVYLSLSVRKYD